VVLAGIEVTDTALVRDAVELARTSLEPYLFNHSMRSWLFGILLSEHAELPPDPELLAVSAVLHDLGLADRYTAEERFEVDGANAARAFLKDRGISMQQTQVVWDAIALHTTRSIALHKRVFAVSFAGSRRPALTTFFGISAAGASTGSRLRASSIFSQTLHFPNNRLPR
jgi:hypothetical protein